MDIIKTLIFLMIIFFAAFQLLKLLTKDVLIVEDFQVLKRTWLQVTLIAFISQYFWIMCLFASVFLLKAKKKIKNITTLFVFILFVIPSGGVQIRGIGGINYLLTLNFPMLITLLLLLPLAAYFFKNKNKSVSSTWIETGVYLFLFVKTFVAFRDFNFTSALKVSLNIVLDILIPFYAFTHLYQSKQKIKEIMIALVMATLLLALIGTFEYLKHWPLYSILKFDEVNQFFVSRGNSLRAIATTQQPIVLGFVIAIGLTIFLTLKPVFFNHKLATRLSLLIFIGGLVATLSRGPWFGALLMVIGLQFMNRNSMINFIKLVFVLTVVLGSLSFTTFGEKLINLIPGIAKTENGSLDPYRTMLIENSIQVASRNPWLGSSDYLDQPEMQALLQGQGIIDITNTYLQVLLAYGYVGLMLFSFVFICTLFSVYRSMKRTADPELIAMGKGLFLSILGVIVMIADVSSITFVPWVYWMLIGLSVSYIKLVKVHRPN